MPAVPEVAYLKDKKQPYFHYSAADILCSISIPDISIV